MSGYPDAPGHRNVDISIAAPNALAPKLGATLKLHLGATFGEVSNEHPLGENRQDATLAVAGTEGALRYLTQGEAANCTQPNGRGGARNRADRQSTALAQAQEANLRAAERHSRVIALPFTRMVTIHWKAAGVPLEGMANATGTFIDKLTKWLARRGARTAWLWVHENTGDKCWHVHILIHIPAHCVKGLPAAQKRWLKQITGRPYTAKVIRSDPIGGRLGLELSNPPLHQKNCEVALAYVLKGASPDKPQGAIMGRRCSTSQNIGRKARSEGQRVANSPGPLNRTPGQNDHVIAKTVFLPRVAGQF